MRVFLTGPFGNIGSHTTAELLRQGHQVRAFDLRTPRTEKVVQRFANQIEVRWGDIRNEVLRRAAAPDRVAEHPQTVAVLASPASPVDHHRRVRPELGGFVGLFLTSAESALDSGLIPQCFSCNSAGSYDQFDQQNMTLS